MDLDQSQLAALTDQEKQELEIWEEFISSRGYAQFQKLILQELDNVTPSINNASTWDQYNYARGMRDAYSLAANIEAVIEHQLQSMTEDRLETSQAIREDDNPVEVNLEAGAY